MNGSQLINNFLSNEYGFYNLKGLAKTNLIDYIIRGTKVRYGEELYLKNAEAKSAIAWVKKYDTKFKNRPKNNNGDLIDCYFLMKLDKDTYAFVQVGDAINSFNLSYRRIYKEESKYDTIKFYIFGKKYKYYIDELKKSISFYDNTNLYIYDVKGKNIGEDKDSVGINSVGRTMDKRDIDTLFFNDHIKEQICSHIENFFVNKSIYEAKHLTYKTGILLYGSPGTGKSSLAIALATKYRYNVIVIDMGTFDKLDTTTLASTINIDTDKYIILLEDIDTLFTSLNREDVNIEKSEKSIVNKMLQFLDSSSSPNDVIFIATTNYIDILDKAITRAGRFDLKIEIGNIDIPTATEMIKSFSIEDKSIISDILNKCPKDDKGLINPAELQNIILDYFKEMKVIEDAEK